MEFICLTDQQLNKSLITPVTLGLASSFCANLIRIVVPMLLDSLAQKPKFAFYMTLEFQRVATLLI